MRSPSRSPCSIPASTCSPSRPRGATCRPTQATANLQAIVTLPRSAPAAPGRGGLRRGDPAGPAGRACTAATGSAAWNCPGCRLHGGHPSEKVIWETIKAHPREVTILALGPLDQRLPCPQRDPGLAELIGAVVACGGTVHASGNATASGRLQLLLRSGRRPARGSRAGHQDTRAPRDDRRRWSTSFDLLDQLPREFTRAGKMLRPMLAHAFRAQRQLLGSEGIRLHDVVALVAVTNPELFERESVVADVETVGRTDRRDAGGRSPAQSPLAAQRRPAGRLRRRGRAGLRLAGPAAAGEATSRLRASRVAPSPVPPEPDHSTATRSRSGGRPGSSSSIRSRSRKITTVTVRSTGVVPTTLIRWSSSSTGRPSNSRITSSGWTPAFGGRRTDGDAFDAGPDGPHHAEPVGLLRA